MVSTSQVENKVTIFGAMSLVSLLGKLQIALVAMDQVLHRLLVTIIGQPNQYLSDDPLWDGQQCEGTCCNGTNSPPWFSVQLLVPTTDMIVMSICGNESTDNEDTPIEVLEIYVQ